MNIAYLLTGSNEGDRRQWLKKAITHLEEDGCKVVQRSAVYETAAWGIEDQPAFLNMALCIHTELPPTQLLRIVNNIEAALGRQRIVKWGQRTLDIDILFYNNEVIDLPELKVPHPQLEYRRFALAPLNEIAPTLVHPISHKTIAQLLDDCEDKLEVKKLGAL